MLELLPPFLAGLAGVGCAAIATVGYWRRAKSEIEATRPQFHAFRGDSYEREDAESRFIGSFKTFDEAVAAVTREGRWDEDLEVYDASSGKWHQFEAKENSRSITHRIDGNVVGAFTRR